MTKLKKLRSWLYRQRLAEKLPELEQELMQEVLEGRNRLGGYELVIEHGELCLKKLPQRNTKQLELPLCLKGSAKSPEASEGS